MVTLKGEHIVLRALEPSDLDFLELTENNEELWSVSHSIVPFSRYQLEQYIIRSVSLDLHEAKQLRLTITNKDNMVLGFIDLFDFDPVHKRAGVGIVISNTLDRGKGYGEECLRLLINYAFKRLNLHQLYCNVLETNIQSLKLFEKCNFEKVGLKKDWIFWEGSYTNEWLLQLINKNNVH